MIDRPGFNVTTALSVDLLKYDCLEIKRIGGSEYISYMDQFVVFEQR